MSSRYCGFIIALLDVMGRVDVLAVVEKMDSIQSHLRD